MAFVSVFFLFYRYIVCLGPFNKELLVHWNFKSQVYDHYFVDFLENGRVFWFQSLFSVCLL